MKRTTRHLGAAAVVALLAIGAGTGGADAATPASGTISKDSPSVSWTGTLAESAVAYNLMSSDPSTPCVPVLCDTFALEVAEDGFDVSLTGNLDGVGSDGTYASIGYRITAPDGSQTFAGGEAGPDKAYKYVIKKAAKGAYTIDTVDSFVGGPGGYSVTAALVVPLPTVAPPATPSPPVTPAPPSGGDEQGTTLRIATRSASARKLRRARRLTVRLTSSAPVSDLVVSLKKGRRTLARGKLAEMASKGKVNLRLKGRAAKLKKGRYTLVATAKDAQGRPAGATARLRVKR